MHVKEEKRGYAFGRRERIRKTEREHKKRLSIIIIV